MSSYEVPEPILNSPFEEPRRHWYIREGEQPELRDVNFCVDLSATPYFLGRVGQETNRPFPWVVTDTGEAKSDESRWMRFSLDTVGKPAWPNDRQGRPVYPEGFEELAAKLERPRSPATTSASQRVPHRRTCCFRRSSRSSSGTSTRR